VIDRRTFVGGVAGGVLLKALGLAMPASPLRLADELIQ
jgi:hypothetical protein